MSSALFASSSGRNQSKNLIEFKAGKMRLEGKMVYPDNRKGLIYIYQADDSLIHFCWKDRNTQYVEHDFIIFPGDCEFKRVPECTTGRVYILKFQSTRKVFFWMQNLKPDNDDENCRRVNEILNNPPPASSRSGGEGELQSLLNNMSQQQLMQLFGTVGVNQIGNLSSILGSASRSSGSSTRSSTSSTQLSLTRSTNTTTTPSSSSSPKPSTSASPKKDTPSASNEQKASEPMETEPPANVETTATNLRKELLKNADLSGDVTEEVLSTLMKNPPLVAELYASVTNTEKEHDMSAPCKELIMLLHTKEGFGDIDATKLGEMEINQQLLTAVNKQNLTQFVSLVKEAILGTTETSDKPTTSEDEKKN